MYTRAFNKLGLGVISEDVQKKTICEMRAKMECAGSMLGAAALPSLFVQYKDFCYSE